MKATLVVPIRLVRAASLITALFWLLVPSLQAGVQFGTVYTRAPVLNPATNAQIWSEYNPENGEIVRDITDAVDEYDPTQAIVISAAQYQSYIERYKQLQETFRDPVTNATSDLIYTRVEYEGTSFKTLDDVIIDKLPLGRATTHVAVRPESLRYLSNPDELILEEYPVDPNYQLSSSVFSLLVNEKGAPLYTSTNRIGIKAAFLSNSSGRVIPPEERHKREYDDTVHGPVPYVAIDGYSNARSGSVADGSFLLAWYDLPCPLMSYMHDGWAIARFMSRRFNPKLKRSPAPYFLAKPYVVFCNPKFILLPVIGPYPTSMGEHTVEPQRMDFVVDTVSLSGTAHMARLDQSVIEVHNDSTRYVSQELTLERELSSPKEENDDTAKIYKESYYDFDGDDIHDTVAKGYWKETVNSDGEVVQIFTTEGVDAVDESLHLQGVYLSSSGEEPSEAQPDLTRAMDWQTNFQHEGMVDFINVEDLENTDMYVFRLTDGKLISERLGLSSKDGNWADELGVDKDDSTFFYHNYLRGYWGDLGRFGVGSVNDYSEWQAVSGMNPELHERKADHLKPGDRVELVAINRATGYIGTTQTTMQPAGARGFGGYLSWNIDPIQMQAPNLKVWVERDYDIKAGLEKGEIREDQIIGYEGAALSSDKAIVVYTDWRKRDGTGLPLMENGDEADYGYTGRIAYLSGDKQIAEAENFGIAQFAIKPGKHMQVLKLPSGQTANQHLYVQVSGEPESGRPVFSNYTQSKTADFTSSGVHTGKLTPRPDRFVPFKVPVFDERATEEQRRIYRRLKRENPETEYATPKPVYQWVYRPDFQYSIYGFEVQELERYEDIGSTGLDLLDDNRHAIASSDKLVSLLYDLEITKYVPLDYFNSGDEKELIFAFGEQEVKATINEDSEVMFANLAHLSALDPEDFLTIQLYTNNDAGNVLWEYAFEFLHLDTYSIHADSWVGECMMVSADDPVVDLYSTIMGYANREEPQEYSIRWSTEGAGAQLAKSVVPVNAVGLTSNVLTMPRIAGSEARVKGAISEIPTTEAIFEHVCVEPGEPYSLTLESNEGDAYLHEIGEKTLRFYITDRWGNPVKDNTSVDFITSGDYFLTESKGLTREGYAEVTIKGATLMGVENTLDVHVGAGLSLTMPIDIKPISVFLTSVPATIPTNQVAEIKLQTSPPLGNAPILLTTNAGALKKSFLYTDDNGEATTEFLSSEQALTGRLTASLVGSTAPVSQEIEVTSDNTRLKIPVPVMIGDKQGFGVTTVEDGMGFQFQAEYQSHVDVTVFGEPSEVVPLALGTQRYPLSRSLLHYPMRNIWGGKSYDFAGARHATTANTSTAPNAPGFSSSSYRFTETVAPEDPDSYILLEDASGLLLPDNWRIDVSLNLEGQVQPGEVYNVGDGVTLTIDSSNELTLTAQTATGAVELQTDALPAGKWYRTSATYENNTLDLRVDEVSVASKTITEPISYPKGSLVIGKDFNGMLSEYKLFSLDTAANAVASFEDGSVEKNVTIGAEGTASVRVISKGRLDPKARLHPISLKAGEDEYTIYAITLALHKQLVAKDVVGDPAFVDALVESQPLTFRPNTLSGFGEPAYALALPYSHTRKKFQELHANATEVIKNAWFYVPDAQFLQNVGNALIDFTEEEVRAIGENLGDMMGEIAEAVESGTVDRETMAIIGLQAGLAVPVVRRYFAGVARPAIVFLKRFKGKPIAQQLSGTILRILKPAAKGEFDELIAATYGLMFVGDMAMLLASGEAGDLADTINEIVDGVESSADLMGIFRFAQSAIAHVPASCQIDVNLIDYYEPQTNLQRVFYTEAYAKGGLQKILSKLNLKSLFRSLKRARAKVDLEIDPKASAVAKKKKFKLSKVITDIGNTIAASSVLDAEGKASEFVSEFLENLIDEDILLAMMVVSHREGADALKAIIKGKYPLRMSAAELFMAIAVIEKNISDGKLNRENYKLPLIGKPADTSDRGVKWKIRDKYRNVFIETTSKKKSNQENPPTSYVAINKLNGDAYHLTRIASLLADGKTVIGVESDVSLQFRKTTKTQGVQNFGKALKRRVDIVTGDSGAATFWEVKSLSYNRLIGNSVNTNITAINTFNLADLQLENKKKNYHNLSLGEDANDKKLKITSGQFYSKEMFIDRAYAGDLPPEILNRMRWLFQDFRKKDMPNYVKHGKNYVMGDKEFVQCGFNASGCDGVSYRNDPLARLRSKLANSIRNPEKPAALDVLIKTFNSETMTSESLGKDYIKNFIALKNDLILSQTSRDWIIKHNLLPKPECN